MDVEYRSNVSNPFKTIFSFVIWMWMRSFDLNSAAVARKRDELLVSLIIFGNVNSWYRRVCIKITFVPFGWGRPGSGLPVPQLPLTMLMGHCSKKLFFSLSLFQIQRLACGGCLLRRVYTHITWSCLTLLTCCPSLAWSTAAIVQGKSKRGLAVAVCYLRWTYRFHRLLSSHALLMM